MAGEKLSPSFKAVDTECLSHTLSISQVTDLAWPGSVNVNTMDIQAQQVYGVGDNYFQVIDVSNPQSPRMLGNINDTSLNFGRGIQAVGQYVYTANRDDNSISIIDVSNPTNPSILSTISDGGNLGSHEFDIRGNYLYGCSYQNDTFFALDISDPTDPTVADVVQRGDSQGAHSVQARNGYAYLTSFSGNSDMHTSAHLEVYDVSDPHNIMSAATLGLMDGLHDLVVETGYLYTMTNGGEFRTVDISDPTNPNEVHANSRASDHRTLTQMTAWGDYILVPGTNTTGDNDNASLVVLDKSDPTDVTLAAEFLLPAPTWSTGGSGGKAVVDGRFVYLNQSNSAGMFRVLDTKGTLDIPSINTGQVMADQLNVEQRAKVDGGLLASSVDTNDLGAKRARVDHSDANLSSVSNVATKAISGSSQTVSSSSITEITLIATQFESSRVVAGDTANDQLLIQEDGTYLVAGQVAYAGSADWTAGDRFQSRVLIGGSVISKMQRGHPGGTDDEHALTVGIAEASAGEAVTLETYQDSGSDQSTATGGDTTYLSVARMG